MTEQEFAALIYLTVWDSDGNDENIKTIRKVCADETFRKQYADANKKHVERIMRYFPIIEDAVARVYEPDLYGFIDALETLDSLGYLKVPKKKGASPKDERWTSGRPEELTEVSID